jgi:putative NIF3 family GTP cyclohydrolase 1 type 2
MTGWDLHHCFASIAPLAKTKPVLDPNADVPTVDGVICGSLDAPVTAVAVCWMLTRANIERVRALGADAVLVHEPVFFHHTDADRPEDAAFANIAQKRALLAELGWLVYRVHDCWDPFPGYGVSDRWAAALGLSPRKGYRDCVGLYETTLTMNMGSFAKQMRDALATDHVRVVGPERPIRRVALGVGACGGWPHLLAAMKLGADIFVAGETSEWQAVRLAEDAGVPMMVVGHTESEEPGMQGLAGWLVPRLSVPVSYVRTAPTYRVL